MNDDTRMCRIKPEDWNGGKDEIRSRVRSPRFICGKCFRVSNSKDLLCKPKKIK